MIRRIEPRDIGDAQRLMEGLSLSLELLGSNFPHPDKDYRSNAYVNTIVQSMFAPENMKQNILMVVAEHEKKVYGFFLAHVHVNYEYARHNKQVYVAALWTDPDKDMSHIKRGRDVLDAMKSLLDWKEEVGATSIFGNAFHKDEISRKLLRRLGFKPTFIRYEGE